MELENVAEPCIIETVVDNIVCEEGNAAETELETDKKEPNEAVATESSGADTVSTSEIVSDVQNSVAVLEISEDTTRKPEEHAEEGSVLGGASEPSISAPDIVQSVVVEQVILDQV
ncbi:unnamed protein product [Cylicostephanus goldi]|uniref:Uncharacterized protein n=1 Tax=Cylicostephanus goldi TaxID=71465 RepID=A0A3P7M5A7_CYLGO|nr:unnamed protein product [Cylicostephanus goldi]